MSISERNTGVSPAESEASDAAALSVRGPYAVSRGKVDEVAAVIQSVRLRLGDTISTFSKRCGVSHAAAHYWETGRFKPNWANLAVLLAVTAQGRERRIVCAELIKRLGLPQTEHSERLVGEACSAIRNLIAAGGKVGLRKGVL